MLGANKDLAWKVFKLFEEGISAYEVGNSGETSERTAERLGKAWREFKNQVPVDEAYVPGWSSNMTQRVMGWYQDYQDSVSVHDSQVADDAALSAAIGTHHAKILEVAELFSKEISSDEEDVEAWGHPTINVRYDTRGKGEVKTWVGPQGDALMFGAFASHIEEDNPLWASYLEFQSAIVAAMTDATADPSKTVTSRPDLPLPAIGEVLLWTPTAAQSLISELRRLLLTGVVVGSCQHCPGQAAMSE